MFVAGQSAPSALVSRRIIVIGAGPGGLAAAMLLAHQGHDVTVLERQRIVGGRSATLAVDGFRFDRGATFFLYPRILEEIFAACGRALHSEVDLIRLDPHYRLIFGDGETLQLGADPVQSVAAIARLAPADAAALPRFLAENRAKLAAFRPVLEAAFPGRRSLLRRDLLKALPLMRPGRSVDRDLARFFRDPRIRLAFSFQSKYLGMSPFRCPSLFTILSFMEQEYGVFHPRGGCGAVMTALARVARELGARIRVGEAVETIEFRGRRAVGVRTERAFHPCDALVVNADFGAAMQRLVPDRLRRRWSDRRLGTRRWSCSTFMLYLGIEGRVDALPHHTIALSRDYARNLAEIERGDTVPVDPSFYVQNACITDPALAPAGHSTLYVLVPVGHRHADPARAIDWSRAGPALRAQVLARLERLGVPDLERRIRVARAVTPADWERDQRIFRGATFNLAHTLGQMLHRRPRNRYEELDGVYLVGGGTHPGSGLPVIFESARITARLIGEDLGVTVPAVAGTTSPMPFSEAG